jgi:2,4-dienoyl-CoA reductase-like NADH-dependent reductase (Old Yellow Enzyme family)/thioredoxin reductase
MPPTPFHNLFTPFSIGPMKLANRIVMPPMATNYATPEGFVTDRQIAYYVERAKGGVGYLTTEHTGILQQGKASPRMLLVSTDGHIPGLKSLVQAVHAAAGKMVIQISHAGRQTLSSVTGMPIVGPSPIPVPTTPAPPGGNVPHELSVGEIQQIVEAFSAAARRVKEAGADGLELHMAHGYLICSFLSPFSNKRTDRYGGSVEKRARFAVEVLRAVRTQVGPDYPVICRLSGDEYVEGGLRIEDTIQIAKILEKEGADALHVSACNAASAFLNHPPYYVKEGIFVHLAESVRSAVSIPVIAVGRIRKPSMADQIISEGKADLVSMGRALIADPHMPRKAKEGRLEDIVPCISCNRCIQTLRKDSVRCTVNPETGNEATFPSAAAGQPKKVWVVGGGPGGLKAAEIAALRGHRVTLFEKQPVLGGKIRIAANPPKKEIMLEFVEYLDRRVRKLGVSIQTGTEFTAEMLDKEKPDAVVVATGAIPVLPAWQGIKESGAVGVEDVLSGAAPTGNRVLVVGGGGNGAEVADFLSEQGKEVTIVEMLDAVASDLVVHLQHFLLERLREKGVVMLTSSRVCELGKGFAVIEDRTGRRRLEGFDTIVIATGSAPDDTVYHRLKGKIAEIHVIGDAVRPREILDAVYEGERVAFNI